MKNISARYFAENFKYKAIFIFFISIILLIYGLIDKAPKSNFVSAVGFVFLIISLAFFGKHLTWKSGAIGEEIVSKDLLKISGIKIYNDLKIPGYSWNIDHIILSKNGIFLVETKNYSGEIVIKNEKWVQRIEKGSKIYENLLKNPIFQAKKAAAKLSNFLKENGVSNIWIHPIVVFANDEVKLNIPPSIPVIKRNEIKTFIENQKYNLSEKQILEIDTIFNSINNNGKIRILMGLSKSGWFSYHLNNAKFGLIFGIIYTIFTALLFWEIKIDDITYGIIFQGIATFILGGLVLEFFNLKFKNSTSRYLITSLIGIFLLGSALLIFGLDKFSIKNWLIWFVITRIFLVLATVYILQLLKNLYQNFQLKI